jgi:hypothetical protein
MIPALPAFAVLGLLFLWLGSRRGDGRPESAFLIGSRPPRRRRNRGLS